MPVIDVIPGDEYAAGRTDPTTIELLDRDLATHPAIGDLHGGEQKGLRRHHERDAVARATDKDVMGQRRVAVSACGDIHRANPHPAQNEVPATVALYQKPGS